MNKLTSIIFAILLVMVAATVQAQDKKDMFNPVNTSVTSQTIAPDARAAGMCEVMKVMISSTSVSCSAIM